MPDGKRRLTQDFTVEVDGLTITVPAGTITDYSSIPSFASWIVHWSKVDIAGVVHDYLYRMPYINYEYVDRARADKIWYFLALEHANKIQSIVCWAGLRIGGWAPWRRLRQTDIF